MAFSLRPDETVAHGLRRLARKELRAARDELRRTKTPSDAAIHNARTRIKKVRAIVALIDADQGTGLGKCPRRLRAVNRTLSRLRDADAVIEILTKLKSRDSHLFDEHTLARLRRRLTSERQQALKAAEARGVWQKIDRELRKLRQDAKRWRPAHRQFGALAAGLEVTYSRGRKAMARARKRQLADKFHEWRKQIKALWYQLRLIERSDRPLRSDVRLLHQVETWLGDDHNIAVLCAKVSKETSGCDLERLRRVANRYQCELRNKTLASKIRQMYHGTPQTYVRRIRRAWNAWQQHGKKASQDGRTADAAA